MVAKAASNSKNGKLPTPNAKVSRARQLQKELEAEVSSMTPSQLSKLDGLASEMAFYTSVMSDNPESYREGVSIGNLQAGSLSGLMNVENPKDRRGQIIRARYYYDTDDLLGDLIDVKLDIATSGITLQPTPPATFEDTEASQKELIEFRQSLDFLQIDMDFEKLVQDLLKDWFITDSMILYWRIDPTTQNTDQTSESSTPSDAEPRYGIPGIKDICTLNPAEVDWNNSLGRDVLMIDIPKAVQAEINKAFEDGNNKNPKQSAAEVRANLIKQGFGEKWIDAVVAKKTQVELKNEDGDYWAIRTRARRYHGLADPSMKKIFLTLAMRQMMSEGEFSAAFMLKHFIMLLKQGESITQGPLAGNRKNWMKPGDGKKLLTKFSVVAKAMRIAADHTTKIEFVFPPAEMFSAAKFETAENRIHNWVGIAKALMTGDSQNYGGGLLSSKKLIAHIQKVRKEIRLLFYEFFGHSTIAKRVGTPEKFLISVLFDETVLKEPRQLLEEVKFLFQSKISDPRSAAKELNRDPDTLKSSTLQSRQENETLHVWEGVGGQGEDLPGQGRGAGGGRPAGDGTQLDEETRNQPPSGRRSADD